MSGANTSHWQEDLRFWLRQQQAWNDLRNLQRDGLRHHWQRLTIWPKILRTPPFRTAPVKPGGPVEYHVMCHNADWLLAIWMLKSLLLHLPEKPQLIIHIESPLRPSNLTRLRWHFPDARVIQPEEGKAAVAQLLLKRGFSHCLHWTHESRVIYKLLFVQVQAASTNIVGLDPDILFFNPPKELIAVNGAPLRSFTFQEDQLHGYTLTRDEAKTGLGIDLKPKINTGIILQAKGALHLQRVEELLKSPLVAKPSGHIEQTLYALCASEAGLVQFLPPTYALNMGATYDCSSLICRHYAGGSKRFIATEGMGWLIRNGLLQKLGG